MVIQSNESSFFAKKLGKEQYINGKESRIKFNSKYKQKLMKQKIQ